MPFETNTNLMSTVLQLKAFLSKNSERLKIAVKKTVERYGKANEDLFAMLEKGEENDTKDQSEA